MTLDEMALDKMVTNLLLRKFVNYGQRKSYNMGPRTSTATVYVTEAFEMAFLIGLNPALQVIASCNPCLSLEETP